MDNVNVEVEGVTELYGFYIDKSARRKLQEIAYKMSIKNNNRVTIADVIRLAIDKFILEDEKDE